MAIEVRYQVFVSSTYLDLIGERHAITSALLRSSAIPAGMELFPASDARSWNLIKRVIDECDYYLLVIGGRYGSLDSDGIGFTEKEFDYATRRKKPIMAFLHGQPSSLSVAASELDPDRRAKLDTFREKVRQRHNVRFWTNADNLALAVIESLSFLKTEHPAIGWCRANEGESDALKSQIDACNSRLAQLERELEEQRASRVWYETFNAGSHSMIDEIEGRLRRGNAEPVRVRWLGVTHEAGWPIIQDVFRKVLSGRVGSRASLDAKLALLDPDGVVAESKFAPDIDVIRTTIKRIGRFERDNAEGLAKSNSRLSVLTYDIRPSWHALLVDDDLAFYSLCVPGDIDLAAPQGGIEVLRSGKSEADDARIAHVRDWFEFISGQIETR
jgi:Domain of unknown function (DUF4062)